MTTYDFLSAKQMILSNVWTDSNFTWYYFWYELGKIMTRYDFLDARFVIWLAIDLLLLLVNIWFWAKNDQIWQPEARWMIFCNIRTDFNFIFGQVSVARKLILNGGAIRPIGLLFQIVPKTSMSHQITSKVFLISFFFNFEGGHPASNRPRECLIDRSWIELCLIDISCASYDTHVSIQY